MATIYNRIAGESIERIAALSDGVFAVAMTLLVLDLKAPLESSIHGLLREDISAERVAAIFRPPRRSRHLSGL